MPAGISENGIAATTSPVRGSTLLRSVLGGSPPQAASPTPFTSSQPALGSKSVAHKEPSPKPAGTLAWPRGDTTSASKPTGFCAVWAFGRSPLGAVVSSLVAAALRSPPRSSMFPGPLPQPITTTAIRKPPTITNGLLWRIKGQPPFACVLPYEHLGACHTTK